MENLRKWIEITLVFAGFRIDCIVLLREVLRRVIWAVLPDRSDCHDDHATGCVQCQGSHGRV